MRSADIRRTFLEFFRERDHRIVPSSPLVPDDPTLLLTTAGMVQFKPFFLGRRRPEYRRAASVQKCARTTDIENVGLTARHLTFFEMLGNFSFGDYFKREACAWSWELVTGSFGVPPDRLWVTVFETDDEAAGAWRDDVGVPEDRIVRRGFEDNYWWMGVPGPGGPCSEIFFDRRDAEGRKRPFEDGDEIVEIWNLVFMQHEVDGRGEVVGDLATRNIDTGMGLERMAAVLQDVPSAYETDLLRPILARAEELSGRTYEGGGTADVSLRIVAEHARTAAFLIGDGVFPSNEDRGYVLRRLIRRAVRHAKLLGIDEPIMTAMVDAVADTMGDVYPEVSEGRAFISQVASQEEDGFRHTLGKGLALLEDEVAGARAAKRLPGAVAFRLHDTFGFPLDLTMEIVAEAGLEVDRDEFERLMGEQQERSRTGRKETVAAEAEAALREVLAERGGSKFLGYEHDSADATVVGIVRGGARVATASEGEEVDVVLDSTPFFPEGGGQIGDAGRILCDGAELEVLDARRMLDDLIVHRAKVVRGEVAAGAPARAEVDAARRAATMRSHTATHLLHWALREALGPHARQAGSLVAPGRLRFDFPHFEQVRAEVMRSVEEVVNGRLAADDPVRPYETTMEEARNRGALMLFEEKYGDIVRVVEIGGYSVELCGGTHVARTSQVGVFKLLGEASIGSNLRRIEALTGPDALADFHRERELLDRVAEIVKAARPEEVPDRVRRLAEDLKRAEDELRTAQAGAQREAATGLAKTRRKIGSADFLAAEVPGLRVDELQRLAVATREAVGPAAVVVLASSEGGRAGIVAALGKEAAAAATARDIIGEAARAIGGGAGGKKDVATGGGNRPEGIADALRLAEEAARERLG